MFLPPPRVWGAASSLSPIAASSAACGTVIHLRPLALHPSLPPAGHVHTSQSLPRMLTLWFDFGTFLQAFRANKVGGGSAQMEKRPAADVPVRPLIGSLACEVPRPGRPLASQHVPGQRAGAPSPSILNRRPAKMRSRR